MLLASLLLAAAPELHCGAPARADADACERLLREGKIESSGEVGEGISGSIRVELGLDGAKLRAIFKNPETEVEGYTFGGEKVKKFRDSWKHEVAAYDLDRLLGMRLVPATVERSIGGKRGSLQAWVDRPIARFGQVPPPENPPRAEEYLHAQRFFDYLIFNTDRHIRNVLLGQDWRPVAIDNSIAFHGFRKLYRPLYRFPRGPLAALEKLEPRVLREKLGRHLEKDELEGLVERRKQVLALAAEARAEGRQDAFFDW